MSNHCDGCELKVAYDKREIMVKLLELENLAALLDR